MPSAAVEVQGGRLDDPLATIHGLDIDEAMLGIVREDVDLFAVQAGPEFLLAARVLALAGDAFAVDEMNLPADRIGNLPGEARLDAGGLEKIAIHQAIENAVGDDDPGALARLGLFLLAAVGIERRRLRDRRVHLERAGKLVALLFPAVPGLGIVAVVPRVLD